MTSDSRDKYFAADRRAGDAPYDPDSEEYRVDDYESDYFEDEIGDLQDRFEDIDV